MKFLVGYFSRADCSLSSRGERITNWKILCGTLGIWKPSCGTGNICSMTLPAAYTTEQELIKLSLLFLGLLLKSPQVISGTCGDRQWLRCLVHDRFGKRHAFLRLHCYVKYLCIFCLFVLVLQVFLTFSFSCNLISFAW